ncbi:MAG: DUF3667 domain-containing protein [Chitinophagales bacterium]|nr:DUF3667 domain-containing protein [Chitinophagales bacterium]
MGHHQLREEKQCQNCGFTVEERYCSRCGQENIETRQAFHYLFTHFVEDLVHWDGSFWKTIKYLMFSPGTLTKTYLAGKRSQFVAPVKLYIFISFFVFLAGGMITDDVLGFNDIDEVADTSVLSIKMDTDTTSIMSVEEYDALQASLPVNERDTGLKRMLKRKVADSHGEYKTGEYWYHVWDKILDNFPKFLFIYMPVFAFLLWLFQDKKRFYYFDHGIFTLHYFSFLLLAFFLTFPCVEALDRFFGESELFDLSTTIYQVVFILWMLIYYIIAYKRNYELNAKRSILKLSTLIFLNLSFFFVGVLIYALFVFLRL